MSSKPEMTGKKNNQEGALNLKPGSWYCFSSGFKERLTSRYLKKVLYFCMGCYLQHTSLLLERNGLGLVCWHAIRWRCQFNTTQVCRITFCSFFTLADSFFAHHFNRMSGPYLTNCTFKIFVLDRMQFFSCLRVEKGNATPKYVSVCFAFFVNQIFHNTS